MKLLQGDCSTAVRVWHATSSSAHPGPVELCCEAWLDESDRRRAARFARPTSRNQHVVGRGMARRLLGNDTVDPLSIRFAAEIHGKPYVIEPPQAQRPFNVAHTDGLVMCAVGNDAHAAIGIDVERLERRTDPAIADRYFSKPEVEYLRAFRRESQRKNAFLRIWTLKEAFIKAIGTGLQTPLADFAFEEIDSDSPKIRMLNPTLQSAQSWMFFSIQPRPGFVAAIAVAPKRAAEKIDFELLSFDELVG